MHTYVIEEWSVRGQWRTIRLFHTMAVAAERFTKSDECEPSKRPAALTMPITNSRLSTKLEMRGAASGRADGCLRRHPTMGHVGGRSAPRAAAERPRRPGNPHTSRNQQPQPNSRNPPARTALAAFTGGGITGRRARTGKRGGNLLVELSD